MAPLIPRWIILEDLSIILVLSSTPSSVDLLPHHNNLCTGHSHWHISTPLPLQLSLGVEELGLEELGVEELGLEGENDVGI